MLVRWADETSDLSTKRLMFQASFFFMISYRLRPLKTLYLYFCKFIKKKMDSFRSEVPCSENQYLIRSQV